MAQDKIPRNRRDLANILRVKDNKIPETVDEVVNILNIEEDLRESVTSYVEIVQVDSWETNYKSQQCDWNFIHIDKFWKANITCASLNKYQRFICLSI